MLNITEKNKTNRPVDFLLLYELMEDARELSIEQIIIALAMNGTEMTYPVQKLGWCIGVLHEPNCPPLENES